MADRYELSIQEALAYVEGEVAEVEHGREGG